MTAIQYELGIDPSAINGYSGPITRSGLKGRGSGRFTGGLLYMFRSTFYFNYSIKMLGNIGLILLMYRLDDIGTDAKTGTHPGWVRTFRNFSQIPVTGTDDSTTWAQL